MIRHALRSRRWFAAVAALVAITGGATVPEQIETTAWELRLRVYDLGMDTAADIERAADSIIAETDSPEVARNALLWKANAIPVLYRAVFQLDPLAALIEMTVFSMQAERFFTDGAGRDVFGLHQSRAVTVSRQSREQSVDLARQVTGSSNLPDARELAMSWAAAYPIDDLSFARQSTVALWAEEVGADRQGGMAVVANIDESFQDLLERLKIYAAEMPKQVRWQAQLATADLVANEDVRLFLGDVRSIEAEIDTIARRFDDFVVMVDAMYAEAWQQMSVERVAAMADVDAQRVATMDQLAREREIVLAALAHDLRGPPLRAAGRIGAARLSPTSESTLKENHCVDPAHHHRRRQHRPRPGSGIGRKGDLWPCGDHPDPPSGRPSG